MEYNNIAFKVHANRMVVIDSTSSLQKGSFQFTSFHQVKENPKFSNETCVFLPLFGWIETLSSLSKPCKSGVPIYVIIIYKRKSEAQGKLFIHREISITNMLEFTRVTRQFGCGKIWSQRSRISPRQVLESPLSRVLVLIRQATCHHASNMRASGVAPITVVSSESIKLYIH